MIREIRPEDCAAVAGFWRDCLDVPAATDESVRGTLDRMRSDDRYFTYVAEEDGRVVGFITCVEVLSFDDPDGYVKINGLAVLPEYRGRGIGTRLVARAEQTARERGSDSVGVASVFKRTRTHELYERLGYRRSAYWFHKDVGG